MRVKKSLFFDKVMISTVCLVTVACFLGTNFVSLFDWDELNFAEISREMMATGNWLQPTINYLPFHEKPPLFPWLQALSYQLFDVTPRGARFPNLVCGLLTFTVLFRLGRNELPMQASSWWAFFLMLSCLPLLYFQTGIIDPLFNLFIFLGLWPSLTGKRLTAGLILQSGLFLGLAVLTKGPAAGLIAGLCWVTRLVITPGNRWRPMLQYAAIGLLALVPILLWIAVLWQKDGGFFAREFLSYQWRLFFKEDAGHGGFPGYHVFVLLFGCFPASWFALPALLRRKLFASERDRGMRILFWVVLILFSIVNTKIVHYSSMCYLPLAWFAARSIGERQGVGWGKYVRGGLLFTWFLYTLITLALPVAAWALPDWLPLVNDAELTSRLELEVAWPWYTILPALIGLVGITWSLASKRWTAPPQPQASEKGWYYTAAGHLVLTGLFLLAAVATLAPRIQQYSQGAATDFFADQNQKDVYVGTAYYKSYAHWYFAAIPPHRYAEGCKERQCRFHEPISRPLYFASPLRKTEQVLREVPDATLINQRGGFSFYRRPASIQQDN